ncbi:hypothetical protein [Phocaeicola abscessus]|nr:hypothetical protein [Phocaeicola abscessus]
MEKKDKSLHLCRAAEGQYASPQIEVIEVETSQVLCGSGTLPGLPGEDW